MKDIQAYIKLGVIEQYVLGLTTDEETAEIELLAPGEPMVAKAIDEFCQLLENYAFNNTIETPKTVKPFLMATIDYMERLGGGEEVTFPPYLSAISKIEEYSPWLNRKDLQLAKNFDGIYAKIIGFTPQVTTAIVWIKEMAPQEIHTDEFEHFLIVEGTCTVTIGDEVHNLQAGNYLSIPLFKTHHVTVTSTIPCKVVIQRVAA